VTGLVDFGAMDVDTNWVDVARLFVDFDDPDLRRAALDAYGAGPGVDALLMPLVRSAAVLIGAHWIRWHFVEHCRFERADAAAAGLGYAVDRIRSLPG
jgi:hypothetical protein